MKLNFVKSGKTFSLILIVLLGVVIAYNLIVPSLFKMEGFVEGAAKISDTNFKKIDSVELSKKDFQNNGKSLKQAAIEKVAEKIVDNSVAKKKDAAELAKNLSTEQIKALYKNAK